MKGWLSKIGVSTTAKNVPEQSTTTAFNNVMKPTPKRERLLAKNGIRYETYYDRSKLVPQEELKQIEKDAENAWRNEKERIIAKKRWETIAQNIAAPNGGAPVKPRKGTYESMTVPELQERCKKYKIKTTGLRKAELISALRRG